MRGVFQRLGAMLQADRLSPRHVYIVSGAIAVILIGGFAYARSIAAQLHQTNITINGARLGPAFQGVGAISGGGGNSRLLIEYPPRQRQQILDYLFKPGYGADVQILKLEIGGDGYATDGAEPTFEQVKGQINCDAGYEFWLARQARKLDPRIQLYALQWNAPHWVGGAWSMADIGYLLDYLKCAKEDGVAINYLGGWNELLPQGITSQVMNWFVALRAALDKAGFANVQLVAVDSFAQKGTADVAYYLAAHPAFAASIGVLGYHNLCKYPSTGRTCVVPKPALTSGKVIWESEIGALRQHTGVAAMTRSINNAYIQVKATGLLEWPLVGSMPPYLPEEDRGLVFADQPWSGEFHVNLMTWVLAQTTQFTAPGWRHVVGASGKLGGVYGSYTSYEAPDHSAWSLVAQTADARLPQVIGVNVDRGLPQRVVHVWSTNIRSANPATWFVRQPDAQISGGSFSYRLLPGHIYTFTTTRGQGKGRAVSPAPAPMKLPYTAAPDASGEPIYLGAQDGSFEYPAGGSASGAASTFAQTTVGEPVFWQDTVPSRFPYAVVGDTGWRDYTVSAQVSFTGRGQSAGVIARFDHPKADGVAEQFHGYQFILSQSGQWRLIRNAIVALPSTLATGHLAAPVRVGTWTKLALSATGAHLVGTIDGTVVTSVNDGTYASGDAGICTGGWYRVWYRDLTVTR